MFPRFRIPWCVAILSTLVVPWGIAQECKDGDTAFVHIHGQQLLDASAACVGIAISSSTVLTTTRCAWLDKASLNEVWVTISSCVHDEWMVLVTDAKPRPVASIAAYDGHLTWQDRIVVIDLMEPLDFRTNLALGDAAVYGAHPRSLWVVQCVGAERCELVMIGQHDLCGPVPHGVCIDLVEDEECRHQPIPSHFLLEKDYWDNGITLMGMGSSSVSSCDGSSSASRVELASMAQYREFIVSSLNGSRDPNGKPTTIESGSSIPETTPNIADSPELSVAASEDIPHILSSDAPQEPSDVEVGDGDTPYSSEITSSRDGELALPPKTLPMSGSSVSSNKTLEPKDVQDHYIGMPVISQLPRQEVVEILSSSSSGSFDEDSLSIDDSSHVGIDWESVSDDSSAASSGSTDSSGSSGIDHEYIPRLPEWLQRRSKFGIVSISQTQNLAKYNSGVAVLVAPRFAIFAVPGVPRADEIRGWYATNHVGEQVRIMEVFHQNDPEGVGSANRFGILILELEEEFPTPCHVHIEPGRPVRDVLYDHAHAVDVSALYRIDDGVSKLDLNFDDISGFAFSSIENCSPSQREKSNAERDELLYCFKKPLSTRRHKEGHQPMIGLVYHGDNVFGLFALPKFGEHEKPIIVRFSALDTRQFIDDVTQLQASWASESSFLPNKQVPEHQNYVVKFMTGTDGGFVGCGGVLIAPKFVLTTASCGTRHPDIRVAVIDANSHKPLRVPIVRGSFVSHPMSGQAIERRFDFGLFELEDVVNLSPICLDEGPLDHSDLSVLQVHVPIKEDSGKIMTEEFPLIPVQKLKDDECGKSRTRANNSLSLEVVCVQPTMVQHTQMIYTSCDDLSMGALLDFDGDKPTLVGMAPQWSPSCGSRAFISVRGIANFINAFSYGHSWRAEGARGAPYSMLPSNRRFVVGIRATRDGQNFCAGSLVAPNYVLTAAHCVTDGLANWISIGSKSSSGKDSEQIRVVLESIRIHPKYGDPYVFSYDAAIVELITAAYAEPVPLDDSKDYPSGLRGTMYGYGVMSPESDVLSPVVRIIDLPIYSRADCARGLPQVDQSVLCAGGVEGEDACSGDSGGPLVISIHNQPYLAGFVSSGYGCGVPGVPGIYMRVSELRDFINSYAVAPRWRYFQREDQATLSPLSPTPSEPVPSVTPDPTIGNSSRHGTSAPSAVHPLDGIDNLPETPSPVGPETSTSPSAAPINTVEMADIPLKLRNAIILFILGVHDDALIPSAFVNDLLDYRNQLYFFSTGDLESLFQAVSKRRASELYSRRNRFPRDESLGKDPEHRHALSESC